MGQSFDHWHVIRTSDYLCRLHIILLTPCVSMYGFTSKNLLFQSPIRISCSTWSIHFVISVLRSIQNWFLGSFWISIKVRYSSCWLYNTPFLTLTVGQYAVTILLLILLFPCCRIHDQQPRFQNYLPIGVYLHDPSSTAMMAVSPLWNGPSEVVTRLYPVLNLLVLNHPSILLYIFSFMSVLLQLLFT